MLTPLMTRRPNRAWLVAACISGLVLALEAAPTADQKETGTLALRVMLVASDLSVKPVPKQRFVVVPEDEGGETTTVSTRFDGGIEVALPPGRYRVRIDVPIEFQGKKFSWDVDFEIVSGSETVLELSNDNAQVEQGLPPVMEGAALYEEYKDGVFKVISDSGHGSGFLIDASGLVMTNHHVIVDAKYLAVKIDDEHKHQAVLLAEDAIKDVAILQVHPDVVRGLPILELADDGLEHPAVTVGETVLAIGSPLTAETILTSGLVSKVEPESIYSDVNINPGNSGGPLFNSRGQVVGITTFGLQAESGPGVSGITRIYVVRNVLEEARRMTGQVDPPGARALPVASIHRLSPETVREMAISKDHEAKAYHLEAGKIDIHFLTSVSMAAEVVRAEREAQKIAEKRRRKKRKKHGGNVEAEEERDKAGTLFYEWQKNNDNFRPVVGIRAFPEIKMTFGSAFAVAMVGAGGKYRFKTDFGRMELLRGGEPVEPIHPGRIREVVNVSGGGASMKDVGYWGLYEYPPEAFAPGDQLTLKVWQQDVPEPTVLPLPALLVESIRADLKPYYESKKAEQVAAPNP